MYNSFLFQCKVEVGEKPYMILTVEGFPEIKFMYILEELYIVLSIFRDLNR